MDTEFLGTPSFWTLTIKDPIKWTLGFPKAPYFGH